LKKALEIKKQKWSYGHEFGIERRNVILSEIKKSDCSINYLAQILLISPRSLRNHAYYLINQGKIARKKVKNEFIYYAINQT
jgi:predicted ArsR family transcriptional regulator